MRIIGPLLAIAFAAQPAPPSTGVADTAPPVAVAPSPATAPADQGPVTTLSPDGLTFDAWRQAFAARALASGLNAATLTRELGDLMPNPRVIDLDRAQPGQRPVPPPFTQYITRHITPITVTRGLEREGDVGTVLPAITARYGVPGPILLAIWGTESGYGSFSGSFDVVRSLATLAWEGRRRALFEGELIAALKLIEAGSVTRERLLGSWAGATGQPQFLPSSYGRLAADGDGDGRADIWTNPADALASIANYLRLSGWQPGQRWGTPVTVPATLDRTQLGGAPPSATCTAPLARHSRFIPISGWRALGLTPAPGYSWPPDATQATLIEPDGPGGPAFLTYGNYRAILAYNCSNYYALQVGLLADRLDGIPDPLGGVR